MFELPWEDAQLQRFGPPHRRLADGRPRDDRWAGSRLDLLLPYRAASYSDPVESP